ncbi:9278_t:CDS:1, partial [Funneliformis mosseae]
ISQLRSCHEKDKQHKQDVLDTVRMGVYVENIYKLDLPRKRDQREQQINDANDIHAKNAKKSSIYNLVFALYDNRRSLIVRNDHFNLDNDNDMIALL